MNIREGLRRTLIVGTIVAEIAMVMYIHDHPSYAGPSDDMLAMAVFGVLIAAAALASWFAGNWIIRGFVNSK